MVSKPEYNSLQDAHLAHHFRKPVVFRHLLCMGLVTPEGKVLSEREWKNSQRLPSQEDQRTPRLLSLASEGNLRPPKGKRKGVAGEPYLDSLTAFKNSNSSKTFSIRSARGTLITKCSQVWERLCPPPNYNISISSWRRAPTTPAYFTLRYLGKRGPAKILILQQPSGINSVPVFSGTVLPEEEFNFTSCRAREASFSLVVYENGLCTSRVNTCCERRYYKGRKIGGTGGHFLVTEVQGGTPCNRCESVTPVDSVTSYSKGQLRKAIGTKITIDVQLADSDSDARIIKEKKRKKKQKLNKEELDNLSDSPHSSTSDLKSRVNDPEEVDEESSATSDEEVNYDSNVSKSDSEFNYSPESDSKACKKPETNITSDPSEDSKDESESKYDEESHENKNDSTSDDDTSKKTNSKSDDYSSDFTSSHSTIKEQAI